MRNNTMRAKATLIGFVVVPLLAVGGCGADKGDAQTQAGGQVDVQAIADRVEIEALRDEFTDAGMMRDYDRAASLFTRSPARDLGEGYAVSASS
jgi:hypothetical protein